MFERLITLIGENNYKKITTKTILVIGLGGVGGYTVESLIRSGINNIIIIDNDMIDITNLNRQIITNKFNIGYKKVDECEKRIKSINECTNVTKLDIFLDKNNINILDKYNIDYIIDCCDTIDTKKELIKYCINKNIKLISCMGTGNKLDPTKLEIIDIRKTNYDPIAKILRKYIKEEKINKKIMVVSSKEQPIKNSTIGSISAVVGCAGLLCSNYVINDIIKESND